MERRNNELVVVTKAKDLCSYVLTITQRCPKHFRFTFVSRLQNLSLSIIENIYRANEVYAFGEDRKIKMQQRLDFQHAALTELKLLLYMSLLALEQKCILFKQYEQISKQAVDTQNLIGAWINSDKRRMKS